MSNCDCQENIKKPIEEDGPTVAATVAEKPVRGGLLITVGIFLGLRAVGVGQHDALLTFTSLVWLLSLLVWER